VAEPEYPYPPPPTTNTPQPASLLHTAGQCGGPRENCVWKVTKYKKNTKLLALLLRGMKGGGGGRLNDTETESICKLQKINANEDDKIRQIKCYYLHNRTDIHK
jgi:hypothetical protein